MARRYGPNIRAYIEKHCGEGSLEEMRGRLRERFGVVMTYAQIKSYYANHKFHAKPGAGNRGQRTFPHEAERYIREHAAGRTKMEMCEELRERFGIEKTPAQLKSFYGNNQIKSGLNTKYKPGHVPANKGKPLPDAVRAKTRATQFQKGNKPHNAQPIGSESKIDGYWKIKIREPNVWQLKSRHEWERIHGEKLKASDVILFLDMNSDNFDPDNLVKVSRADLARINQDKLRGADPEINMAAVNLARLKTLAKNKQKKNINRKKSE